MVDGYVLMEYNKVGEPRIKEGNVEWLDIRLQCSVDFKYADGESQIIDQLPKYKDKLIMVFFKYVFETDSKFYYDFYNDGGEELINVISHHILKENYQAFHKLQVTEELEMDIKGFGELKHMLQSDTNPENNYYKNLVEDYEDFHGEKFKPTNSEIELDNMFKNEKDTETDITNWEDKEPKKSDEIKNNWSQYHKTRDDLKGRKLK